MTDRASRWNPLGSAGTTSRILGRTNLVLEAESSCTVVVLDFVCRCDDITVQLGTQTVAVIDRRTFTTWTHRGGHLVADDLALSLEGRTVFAVINGDDRYLTPATNIQKLTELIANSG